MQFSSPVYLLLLLTLPLFALIGWPSRGPSRGREIVSLVFRLLLVTCLVLGLAGAQAARASDDLSVVYLLDASDSMPAAAKAAAEEYVRQSLQTMPAGDQAAVIVFGANALVERPMSPVRELGPITSAPNTLQTDLAEAIRLALALYPPGGARRMVILSDGGVTTGDAESAAQFAAAAGVQIVAIPFVATPGPEALVTEVSSPGHVREGEAFNLEVTVEATEAMRAGVRVLAGADVVYEGELELNAGVNSFVIPVTAGPPGFAAYRVQISPTADGQFQNNELAAFTQVVGPPRVLIVAPPEGEPLAGGERPDEYSALASVLSASGIETDVIVPSALPSELPLLAGYSSLVLVDVPARSLSARQMKAVHDFVRDLGGGLVAVGGPTSYGVGGYFHTPLEEALPVEMQIKDEQRRPRLTIVFIVDKSGSMSELSGGVSKVELAKEAAIRSVELLAPGDKVGVVAFDDTAAWVVPITDLEDSQAVINRIGSIRADGGTDILAGLEAMAGVLPQDDAPVKHVILLTDGGADARGIPELVGTLYEENGITLTTVGVGADAAPFLPEIARVGGGRYHFAADPASIPTIFTEETLLATRSYIIEEEFYPEQVSLSPILSGIGAVPSLLGYVGTTVKAAAQPILISAHQDPVLAAWQFGLGRSVAWTSDATGRWAQHWLAWEGFGKFWSQAVRYTVNEGAQSNVEMTVQAEGERARLVVDARSESADYLNGYSMQANVVGPDGETQAIALSQVASGRYEATFEPSESGAYLVRVAGTGAEGDAPVAQIDGWVLSYSPEYRATATDPARLARLAAISGGRLGSGDPAEIFVHDLPAARATRPIWPMLLGLAALLLPLDIAVRRLVLGRYDLQRAWMKLADAFASRLQPPSLEHARSEQLGALRRAKDRAGEDRPPPVEELNLAPQGELRDQSPGASQPPPATKSTPTPDTPSKTAASLLAKKRARRDEGD